MGCSAIHLASTFLLLLWWENVAEFRFLTDRWLLILLQRHIYKHILQGFPCVDMTFHVGQVFVQIKISNGKKTILEQKYFKENMSILSQFMQEYVIRNIYILLGSSKYIKQENIHILKLLRHNNVFFSKYRHMHTYYTHIAYNILVKSYQEKSALFFSPKSNFYFSREFMQENNSILDDEQKYFFSK